MELYATPGNPIPPGAILQTVRASDGRLLRSARWVTRASRGTVVVAAGRSEFIEEYYEVVAALLKRNFDVVTWDWRCQGASDRESRWRQRGHVASFAGYRRDLDAIERQILAPVARKPWFAFGHSMGAAILIDQAHDGRSPFERLVLSAPMIGIPYRAKTAVRRFSRLATFLGFGQTLIPGRQRGFRLRPAHLRKQHPDERPRAISQARGGDRARFRTSWSARRHSAGSPAHAD